MKIDLQKDLNTASEEFMKEKGTDLGIVLKLAFQAGFMKGMQYIVNEVSKDELSTPNGL